MLPVSPSAVPLLRLFLHYFIFKRRPKEIRHNWSSGVRTSPKHCHYFGVFQHRQTFPLAVWQSQSSVIWQRQLTAIWQSLDAIFFLSLFFVLFFQTEKIWGITASSGIERDLPWLLLTPRLGDINTRLAASFVPGLIFRSRASGLRIRTASTQV